MRPFRLVAAGLLALCLPSPAGWLLAPGAWLLRWPRTAIVALALLALSTGLAELGRPAEGTGQRAVRLQGRWRQPPNRPPYLSTQAGSVALELEADVRAPPPGSGVDLLARVDGQGSVRVVHLKCTSPPTGAFLDRWRDVASVRIYRLTVGPRRGLARSLLLGDGKDLDGPVRDAFAASGTSHLLALSGLHLSLLAAVGGSVLAPLLASGLLLPFTLLAGGKPPLLRALGTRTVAALCRRHGRPSTPLGRLAAVALVLSVLLGPELLLSLSGRLSFLAVGGLLAAMGPRRGPACALLGPAGAVLATTPLCAATFGEFTPMGILVTPLLTPLVAAVLGVGAVAVLPGPAFSALDGLWRILLDGAAELLIQAVTTLAELCPPTLRPGPPPLDPTLLGLAVVWALARLNDNGGARP